MATARHSIPAPRRATGSKPAGSAGKYRCISSSNEVRLFDTYDEAHRFVMREGDKSRLWSLEPVDDLAAMSLIAQAQAAADRNIRNIRDVAEWLANLMTAIHGGTFRAEIDHDIGFVLVRQNNHQPMSKPVRGEVV